MGAGVSVGGGVSVGRVAVGVAGRVGVVDGRDVTPWVISTGAEGDDPDCESTGCAQEVREIRQRADNNVMPIRRLAPEIRM